MYNTEKIKKDLKNNMSQSRYDHSLLVAQEAKLLARHYHIDEEKAYVAGLVHDIAKEFSEDDNKRWIEKYHLSKNGYYQKIKRLSMLRLVLTLSKNGMLLMKQFVML